MHTCTVTKDSLPLIGNDDVSNGFTTMNSAAFPLRLSLPVTIDRYRKTSLYVAIAAVTYRPWMAVKNISIISNALFCFVIISLSIHWNARSKRHKFLDYFFTSFNKWQFLPRDAMLAHYIGLYAVVACLSVCVSVKLRYSIKTAKRRITQIMPHDSHGKAKDNGEIPYGGDECKWGVG